MKKNLFELTKAQLMQEKLSQENNDLFAEFFGYSVELVLDPLTSLMIATSEFKDLYALLVTRSLAPALQLNNLDLRGVDLYKANLMWANLSRSDLSFANLNNAECKNTDFYKAKLCNTECVNTDFSGAKMGFVDLSNANLNLRSTNLWGVYLYGAKFASIL